MSTIATKGGNEIYCPTHADMVNPELLTFSAESARDFLGTVAFPGGAR
jgi:hypothetical protein